MKLYGFTEGKETVAVDLSCHEIAVAGIDPWRLDLWEPDPVLMPVGEQGLQFRRLRDLSFVYRDDDGTIIVGMHDGAQPACVRAKLIEAKKRVLKCKNVVPSNRTFAEHYHEYLTRFCAGRAPEPRCAAAVQVTADRLEFKYGGSKFTKFKNNPVCYVGEMFAPQSIRAVLPDSINSAFRVFREWNPVVHGRSIWNALDGREQESTLVSIDGGKLPELRTVFHNIRCIRTKNVEEYAISGDGGTYYVRERNGDSIVPGPFAEQDIEACSVDCIYSVRENEVTGMRIGLFDFANRQARPLYKSALTDLNNLRLTSQGFVVIPSPSIEGPPKPFITGLPERWDYLDVRIGQPGKMPPIQIPDDATIAEAMEAAGFGGQEFDVRVRGNKIDDLDQIVEDDDSIMLIRPVRGN